MIAERNVVLNEYKNSIKNIILVENIVNLFHLKKK